MTRYQYSKVVDVSKLADEIQTNMGLKVKATTSTDSLNGHINYISGNLSIVFYDIDEAPNENHDSTLVKTILTPEQKAQLDNVVNVHVA